MGTLCLSATARMSWRWPLEYTEPQGLEGLLTTIAAVSASINDSMWSKSASQWRSGCHRNTDKGFSFKRTRNIDYFNYMIGVLLLNISPIQPQPATTVCTLNRAKQNIKHLKEPISSTILHMKKQCSQQFKPVYSLITEVTLRRLSESNSRTSEKV